MGAEDIAFRATMDASGFMSGTSQIEEKLNGLDSGSKESSNSLMGLAEKMTGLSPAALAGTAGIIALAEGLKSCVEAAAPVQQNLVDIGVATGQGTAGLEGLGTALSGTTVGMGEGSAAALQLSDTYKSNNEILAAMPGNIALSESAHMSLGQAISTTTGAITKFNLSGTDTSMVANLFVAGAQHSKESAGQLGEAVSSAGIVAKNLGMDITTTTAVMAMFSQAGLLGANAGTTFSMSMKALTKDNKGVSDALAEMGTSFGEIDPQAHSFDEIIKTLSDHHITLKESQALFGRGGQAMYAVIQQQAGGFQQLKSAITDTEAATTGAEAASSTYEGSMKRLGAAANDAEVAIGNALLPTLAALVNGMADAITEATKLGAAIAGLAGNTVETTGKGNWFDQQLFGMMGVHTGAQESGTATADTWTAAYEEQMQADNSEVDPYVQAALDRQAKAMGTSAGKAFAGTWDAVMTEEQLKAARYAADVNTINANNDRGGPSLTGTLAPPGTSGNLGYGQATSSGFTMGLYLINQDSTGGAAWQFKSEKYGTEPLDQRDPIGSANALVAKHLAAEGKTASTQQFAKGGYGQIITIDVPVQASLWETPFTQQQQSEWLNQNKDAAKNAGGELGEALYNGYFENESKIANSPELSKSWDVLMQSLAKPDPANAQRVSMALGDLVQAGVIAPIWQDSIMKAADEALSGDVITDKGAYLKSTFAQIGTDAGNALKDGILTVQEQETLTKLADEYLKAGGDASDAMIQAIESKDWAGLGSTIGKTTGQSFVDALTGEVKNFNIPKISDILKDPNLQSKISDLPDFLTNTFQPALKKSFDDQYSITKMGYDESISQTQKWIDTTESLYQQHSDWFTSWQGNLLEMEKSGQITAQDAMWVWDQMTNQSTKTADALKGQAVGYDQLKKATQDCADCAISEFGQWQESQDNLFQGSYIGAGGQDYLTWKTGQMNAIAETQRAMKSVGGAVLGQDYTQSPLTQQTIKVVADTSEADLKIKGLGTNIDSIANALSKKYSITADTATIDASLKGIGSTIDTIKTKADPVAVRAQVNRTEIDKLLSDIAAGHNMQVYVSVNAYAGEIQAQVDAAIRNALA